MPYLVSLTRKITRFSVPQLGYLGYRCPILPPESGLAAGQSQSSGNTDVTRESAPRWLKIHRFLVSRDRQSTPAASRTRPWFGSKWGCRVGVFPESEELLIGGFGLGGVALHGLDAG